MSFFTRLCFLKQQFRSTKQTCMLEAAQMKMCYLDKGAVIEQVSNVGFEHFCERKWYGTSGFLWSGLSGTLMGFRRSFNISFNTSFNGRLAISCRIKEEPLNTVSEQSLQRSTRSFTICFHTSLKWSFKISFAIIFKTWCNISFTRSYARSLKRERTRIRTGIRLPTRKRLPIQTRIGIQLRVHEYQQECVA